MQISLKKIIKFEAMTMIFDMVLLGFGVSLKKKMQRKYAKLLDRNVFKILVRELNTVEH